MSRYTKNRAGDQATVTVDHAPDGLLVTRDTSPFPVRLVTSRPGEYAETIAADLASQGYKQVTS